MAVASYRLVRYLREGGICTLYEGVARGADGYERRVIIKRLREATAGDPLEEARLRREAEMLARVSHPTCVQVHNYVQIDGTGAIVMEFVDGVSLADLGAAWDGGERGPVPVDGGRVRLWARDLARAMRALQAVAAPKPFVHGDLHPGNLMVAHDGDTLRLVDYGQARLVDPEREADYAPSAMSPVYAAPEHLRRTAGGPACDMYAFARVFGEWAARVGDTEAAAWCEQATANRLYDPAFTWDAVAREWDALTAGRPATAVAPEANRNTAPTTADPPPEAAVTLGAPRVHHGQKARIAALMIVGVVLLATATAVFVARPPAGGGAKVAVVRTPIDAPVPLESPDERIAAALVGRLLLPGRFDGLRIDGIDAAALADGRGVVCVGPGTHMIEIGGVRTPVWVAPGAAVDLAPLVRKATAPKRPRATTRAKKPRRG